MINGFRLLGVSVCVQYHLTHQVLVEIPVHVRVWRGRRRRRREGGGGGEGRGERRERGMSEEGGKRRGKRG